MSTNYARYWDLDEKTRAGLSYDEVKDYLAVELMERGVLRPTQPVPEQLADVTLEKRTVYIVKHSSYHEVDVAFPTPETAAAFIASGAMKMESDYEAGSVRYAEPFATPAVASIEIATRESILAGRAILRENNARKQRNEKAQAAYEKAVAALDTETRDIWSDWNRCCGMSASFTRIGETWASYLAMAKGDAAVAWKFLLKAFPGATVDEAFEWIGLTVPDLYVPEPCDVVAATTFDSGEINGGPF